MTMTRGSRIWMCAAWMLSVCGISVCQAEDPTHFYRMLNWKENASVADMIRITAEFKGYRGESRTDSELAFLSAQEVKLGRLDISPSSLDRPLTKGTASYVLMRALGVRGGIMYRFFPDSRRYALREAVALQFLTPTSNPAEIVSGKDLIGLFVNILKYNESRKSVAGKKTVGKGAPPPK